MKVLFVLPDLTLGGAQRVSATYARLFSTDCETVLIAISANGALRNELDSRIKFKYFTDKKLSITQQMLFLIWLPFYLRRNRFDVVFSTLFQLNIILGLFKKFHLIRGKLILREANFVSIEWPKSRLYTIFKLLGSISYRSASAVICLNESQFYDIQVNLRIPFKKLFVVPNPVLGVSLDESLEHFPSVDLKGPMILSVGRLEEQKRLDVLIKAFDLYRRKSGRGYLYIVGKGSLELPLKALALALGISDLVFFLGEVSKPYALFRLADLFVLSSDFEGLPNALIQGCYLTQRVVSTNCNSGPESILSGYEGGELVNVGDFTAMSVAFEVMLNKPKVCPSDSWIERYSECNSFNQLKNVIECVV